MTKILLTPVILESMETMIQMNIMKMLMMVIARRILRICDLSYAEIEKNSHTLYSIPACAQRNYWHFVSFCVAVLHQVFVQLQLSTVLYILYILPAGIGD